MSNGQGKDDEAQSLWAGFLPAALFVCGAIVLGYACGHVGGSLVDPCPMSVGDFAEEGARIGIILGAVVAGMRALWFAIDVVDRLLARRRVRKRE